VFSNPVTLAADQSGEGSSGSAELTIPHIPMDVLVQGLVVLAAVSIAMYISLTVHELGHGIALRLYGHKVESFKVNSVLGLFPNFGVTYEDINLEADVGLRAALHVAVGGVTLNLLSAALIGPLWYLGFGTIPDVSSAGFIHIFLSVLVALDLVSVLQIIPLGGTDGDHFQRHLLHAAAERFGVENSPLAAYHASRVLIYGILVAIIAGVVLG